MATIRGNLQPLPLRQVGASLGEILIVAAHGRPFSSLVESLELPLRSRPWLSVCVVTDYESWRRLDPVRLRRDLLHPGIAAIAASRIDGTTLRRARAAVDAAVAQAHPETMVRFVVRRLGRPAPGRALEQLLRPAVTRVSPDHLRSLRRRLRATTSLGWLQWHHLLRLARCPRLGRSVASIAADLRLSTTSLRKWSWSLLGLHAKEYAVRPGLVWVLELALRRVGAIPTATTIPWMRPTEGSGEHPTLPRCQFTPSEVVRR